MKELSRQEQIAMRTKIMDDPYTLVRYRKTLKYQRTITTKQGNDYHMWLDDDIIRSAYYVNANGDVFIPLHGRLLPSKKYREIMDSLN